MFIVLFSWVIGLGIVATPQPVFTGQQSDLLIYKGDTVQLLATPLETYHPNGTRARYFGVDTTWMSTACWRGYVAVWRMWEDDLYLSAIRSCGYPRDTSKADLRVVFGDKVTDKGVPAAWFTDKVLVPQGPLLYYMHDGFQSSYAKELELEFRQGRLVGSTLYDNSKSKKSVFSSFGPDWYRYIYGSIRWDSLPSLSGGEVRVFVTFTANEEGQIDEAEIVKGHSEAFDQEALRVIRATPEWDVYFKYGKLRRIRWNAHIVFSEANRRRYSN